MMPALKAEFRKLWTVRSTYVILAISLLLILLMAGYGEGFKADKAALHNSGLLAREITSAITALGVFGALVSILLFSHEYRYNTIMYSLTSANNRSKLLLAKILAMTGFAVLFSLVTGVISPLATLAGALQISTSIRLAGFQNIVERLPPAATPANEDPCP